MVHLHSFGPLCGIMLHKCVGLCSINIVKEQIKTHEFSVMSIIYIHLHSNKYRKCIFLLAEVATKSAFYRPGLFRVLFKESICFTVKYATDLAVVDQGIF